MIYTITTNPTLDYVVQYNQINIGNSNTAFSSTAFPGGIGINASIILDTLDTSSISLGFLGPIIGQSIEKMLTDYSFEKDFVYTQTDNAINTKVRTQTEETSVNSEGPYISVEDQELFFTKLDKITKDDYLIIDDNLPRNLDYTFFERVSTLVEEHDAKIVANTSTLRPSSFKKSNILTLININNLEKQYNQSLQSINDIVNMGSKLLNDNNQYLLVSFGVNGGILIGKTQSFRYYLPSETVLRTDMIDAAIVTGFISEFSKTKNPINALRVGAATGCSTAFTYDNPPADFIKKIYNQILISEI